MKRHEHLKWESARGLGYTYLAMNLRPPRDDQDPEQAMDILKSLSEEDARGLFRMFDPALFEDVLESLGPWGVEDISYDLKSLLLKLPE